MKPTIITHDGAKAFGLFGLIALMWLPGLISILLRVFWRTGFADLGLNRAKSIYYIWAVAVPLLLAVLINLLSIPLGMKMFAVMPLESIRARIDVILISLIAGIVGALGEEIGWRGFLLPKLIEANARSPLVLSGVIWARG